MVADGTNDLPDHVKQEADPVLVELAGRLDPPHLRRAVAHLCRVADPEGADRQAEHRDERRGLWLASTWEGMVAVNGLLDPEAGHTLRAALEPWARPADANDPRKGSQRTADALTELCRRSLGGCPRPVGCARSCWSPSTWTACWAMKVAWVAIRGVRGRWPRRRAGASRATGL